MTRHTMNLKDRLYDCLPAGRYGLSGLLRLLDVVQTDAVPTAAIECRTQPRLLVNPAFVAEHARTDEKLMMLVMHELHHVLLGHTARLSGPTPADNFVFDCVINALLCRMFPAPAHTALFRDYYRDDAFPACLLRPPEGWAPDQRHVPMPPALRARPSLRAAREVYAALYGREGATAEDVRHLLRPCVAQDGDALAAVPLLGDHSHSAQGEASAGADAFAQGVGEIVRQWPAPPDPLRGQSLDGLMRASRVAVRRTPSARAQLRALLASIARRTHHERGVRRIGPSAITVETPVPAPERRATVLRALGATPLLFRAETSAPRPLPSHERVHVYVDVSGSMSGIEGPLYGAVLDCEGFVDRRIHLFSTVVADVTTAQLRAGLVRSTSGTDLRCVTRHMARHRIRHAVLLTDGLVGAPDRDGAALLRASRIGVGYVGEHASERDLAPYTQASVRLAIEGRA